MTTLIAVDKEVGEMRAFLMAATERMNLYDKTNH